MLFRSYQVPGIAVFVINAVLAVVLVRAWAQMLMAKGTPPERRVYIQQPSAAQ